MFVSFSASAEPMECDILLMEGMCLVLLRAWYVVGDRLDERCDFFFLLFTPTSTRVA